MEASRIEFTARGRRVPFLRAPNKASGAAQWAGFSFEEAVGEKEPMPSHSWPKTTLVYVREGNASLRWRHRGVWSHDPIASGTVSIIRREVIIQAAIPSGSSLMMVLQLDSSRLSDLAPDQMRAIDGSLVAARVTRDVRLASLLSAMGEEAHDGYATGRLYAESVSIALLAYLASRYSAAGDRPDGASGLSPTEMRRLARYIHENISRNISVMELAELVEMSASTFARRFKGGFGMTPYQYVMRARIGAAKKLMINSTMPASRIAAEAGFASQSHFIKVFRQFAGVTPKQFKAGC